MRTFTNPAANHYAVVFSPASRNGGVSGYFYFPSSSFDDAQESYSQEVANFASESTVELVRVRDDVTADEWERAEIRTDDVETFFDCVSRDDLFSDTRLFERIYLHVPEKSEAAVVLPYLTQGKINDDTAERIGMPDINGFVDYEDYVHFDDLLAGKSALPSGTITPTEVFDGQIRVKIHAHIAEFVDDWSVNLNRQVLLGY